MANGQEVMIDAPIPGQSLTAPVGGRPWQQPPQYATVEEALEYYYPKFADPEFGNQLLEIIDLGVPLTTIANSFQMASVMEGKHTIDVGILIIPVLVELMINMAEANNVSYTSGMDKDKEEGGFSPTQIALAKKKGLLDAKPVEKPEMPMPEEQAEPSPMGLMSRREV